MAVRPDLTSVWGGIEVASDGHPAHIYFYDFCIDSFLSLMIMGMVTSDRASLLLAAMSTVTRVMSSWSILLIDCNTRVTTTRYRTALQVVLFYTEEEG